MTPEERNQPCTPTEGILLTCGVCYRNYIPDIQEAQCPHAKKPSVNARQQVREAIGKWLYTAIFFRERGVKKIPWSKLSESTRLAWADESEEILNFTYPSGAKMLAVLDENQDIPTYHLPRES